MDLYLASTSPRRSAILRRLGLAFQTLSPAPDPDPDPALPPERLAVLHALHKARSACPAVRRGIVVGTDTVVCLGDAILGKPRDRSEAEQMLRRLPGRTHRVVSGVAAVRVPGGVSLTGHAVTSVTFRRLGEPELRSYAGSREPLDKAGAYGIQGLAGGFVSRVDGGYLNVVGLPVLCLLDVLRRADPSGSWLRASSS